MPTPTRKLGSQGSRGLRARPRLHGDDPRLRRAGRGGVGRHAASRDRARLHLLRHRRGLRAVQQRGAARPGAGGQARRPDHRHQVRLPRRRQGRAADRQPAGAHPGGRRGVAQAAADRPHRPVLSAPRRPQPCPSRTSPAPSATWSPRARCASSGCPRRGRTRSGAPTPTHPVSALQSEYSLWERGLEDGGPAAVGDRSGSGWCRSVRSDAAS